MSQLKVNLDKIHNLVSPDEIKSMQKEIEEAQATLHNKSGKGNDYLGWLNLPSEITEEEISSIEETVQQINESSEILVVVGIGGSYLGSRAVIDALSNNFSYLLSKEKRKAPLVLFAGQNIGEDYIHELLSILDDKTYSIVVISKSGTTTEPAIAFRLLKQHLENKHGKEKAKSRIFAVTDKSKGALLELANQEGYKTFVIPDDVGGRFSVLTPVGLLPIAAAGFNIRELINGAKTMQSITSGTSNLDENPSLLYAAARNALYKKGKKIEILATYTPNLHYFIEWWKQLYGESEGKDGKGIFPAGVDFTSDLHSMGQMIQDGERNIFETVIKITNPKNKITVPEDANNLDKLNYIAGKRIHEVNDMATLGTILAHVDGNVPNIQIELSSINENVLGQTIYFYEKACAVSGYTLGVNPFDQPGVEAYKKNMFALLGKPGFEKETEEIRKKIN